MGINALWMNVSVRVPKNGQPILQSMAFWLMEIYQNDGNL
jgi:hypothetical protein